MYVCSKKLRDINLEAILTETINLVHIVRLLKEQLGCEQFLNIIAE